MKKPAPESGAGFIIRNQGFKKGFGRLRSLYIYLMVKVYHGASGNA